MSTRAGYPKGMSEQDTGSAGGHRSQRIKQRIQDSIDAAHEERRRELLRRRIELARTGIRNYQARRIADAATAFHTYLKILEDWKRVPEGGLHPGLFERPKDLAELLLISGVYWDLAKMYDRTRTKNKQKEFKHYLEKFILFSRGMPFQPLCAETMRKYISNEKPVHRDDFKNAYKLIGTKPCFVATSLADVSDSETVPRLRAFRDEVLSRSGAGRSFVAWYYRNGEAIAARVDRLPDPVRRAMGVSLDGVSRAIAALMRR